MKYPHRCQNIYTATSKWVRARRYIHHQFDTQTTITRRSATAYGVRDETTLHRGVDGAATLGPVATSSSSDFKKTNSPFLRTFWHLKSIFSRKGFGLGPPKLWPPAKATTKKCFRLDTESDPQLIPPDHLQSAMGCLPSRRVTSG